MEPVMAVVIGILVAASAYLMLDRNIMRFLFGLVLLSNAANVTIFVAGRFTRAEPPLVPEGSEGLLNVAANALPQALVLTAIVIGFGLLAFLLALIFRAYKEIGTMDSDTIRIAEPVEETTKEPKA